MRTMQCVRTLNLRLKFDVHHPAAGARRLWLHGTYLLYGCMAGICGPADVGRPMASSALADMVRCAASLRMDGGAVSWCAETPCAGVSGIRCPCLAKASVGARPHSLRGSCAPRLLSPSAYSRRGGSSQGRCRFCTVLSVCERGVLYTHLGVSVSVGCSCLWGPLRPPRI